MALSYRARRRLSLLVLLLGLPAYVVGAVSVINATARLPFLAEMLVYAGLGVGWIWPFKLLFRGIGQPDPADPAPTPKGQP